MVAQARITRPRGSGQSSGLRDDRDLLLLLRGGDEGAFAEIVERYHGRLIRLAGRFVARCDLAEDVAQEARLALIRGIDRFEGRSSLRSWLFQICANRARSVAAREDRNRPAGYELADSPTDDADPLALVEERLDADRLACLAVAAIERLPSSQREVEMRDVEGMSSGDVSDLLGISDGNQRVLLHRGRVTVRAEIAPALLTVGA
jgi:RNA polymerase sigma-70 factor, ECF subfamily